MGEVDVKGPGAERLINQLLVNEIRDLEPGQVRYSTMCNEDGGVVDDITVYKFSDEHFMIVTSSAPRKKTARWIADHAIGTGAYVTDISASIALPVVQGPRSREFLTSIARDADLGALKYFRFTTARVGDTELVISRSGYTGELGYELYTPAEEAGALWEHLLQTGREFGLRPYGVAAMHTLRLEKGYVLYGVDLDEEHTPFNVGLDRWIRFDKRSFIGREALLRAQEQGLDERWVGLTLQGDVPAAAKARVLSVGRVATSAEHMFSGPEAGTSKDKQLPGEEVGYVTHSGRGHTVGKLLAMAYVSTSHAWPGSRLLVEVGERYFPDGAGPTMTLRACLFTNTPDHHFIIDLHPDYPQVAFTSPCSGHGFKFASVLGEIMADLAERGETRHNIELFRMERFAGHPRAHRPTPPARQNRRLTRRHSYQLQRQTRRVASGLDGRLYEPRTTFSVVAEEAEDTIRPFW